MQITITKSKIINKAIILSIWKTPTEVNRLIVDDINELIKLNKEIEKFIAIN